MRCFLRVSAGGALLCAVAATSAVAEQTSEEMVQAALPLMHHTCNSLRDEAQGDEQMVIDAISKMTALILINRQIDITAYIETDADKDKIRADYVAALKAGCAADRDALLGGVVDDAVKQTLGL